jgi:deoxyribonuclease IV
MKKVQRLIGAHMSAAGGVDKAVVRAAEIGCNAVQVFSGSPRVWARTSLDAIDTDKIFSKQQELSVSPIIIHALYLVNLASDNPELVTKSRNALRFDLQFDSLVKGSGVVVHLGSHQGRGWESSRDQVASEIKKILADSPDDSHFLIENSAGQNGKLCSDLAEIRWLLDEVKSDRLGWCVDTCHAHAAGYEVGQKLGQEIARLKLWSSLKCIHVNESRDPFDSGRDRHANFGEGLIGSEAMSQFLALPDLQHIPMMTEAPGIDGMGPDAENIKRLKAILEVK